MDLAEKLGGCEEISRMAKELFRSERARSRLDGWFICREIAMKCAPAYADYPPAVRAAETLSHIAEELPLSIEGTAIFAGTQRDAFARSYALINPSFKVDSFSGYCDPTAVYGDIEPNAEYTRDRIEAVRDFEKRGSYVSELNEAYSRAKPFTEEVIFFMEQVTGHVIADYRTAVRNGILGMIDEIEGKHPTDETQRNQFAAMKIALRAMIRLAERYAILAESHAAASDGIRRVQLLNIAETLRRVPAYGARDLYEAIQSYMLLWQFTCLEQAPNPFALSAGNIDRIFEPYREAGNMTRDEASSLFRHLLVFFNVGDRSWAISQNILVGGRDTEGRDLTSITSYALLDAYYDMNLPQPILSVKLHKNTPERLYAELGRFFFTPGCLTPSFFNDDMLFGTLIAAGIEKDDLPDYSIAGCQEPLIMGRDNGNTTNTWLNLGKILEITLSGGLSTITGKKLYGQSELSAAERLSRIRELFYKNAENIVRIMAQSGNDASRALSNLPVPFLSAFMGGVESGYDMRDTEHQGTRYNGSGCLIHGLTVVSDSFVAVDRLLRDRPQDADRLIATLANDFAADDELRQYLLSCPKFGNNESAPDTEAAKVAEKIAALVRGEKNYLGNPFRPDFSTPSTHLLYGYWVGALPCGRKSRDMLNYGVDPFYGDANSGLGFRTLSARKLPYRQMCGGYASHLGIDPGYFSGASLEEKGLQFRDRVLVPLFSPQVDGSAPFYLYLNVTTPEILRKVLENPKKYAPSGIYIMRIHGTFVNFLDLSPEIQQDIITRLDPKSTYIS